MGDLSSSVSISDMVDRLGGFAQRIRAVDDRSDLAGFDQLLEEPGIWELGFDGPTVDLLVPRSLRPVGRRGARLGIDGNQAAKTVPGLEGALVDHDRLTIRALLPGDRRRFRLRVAGPAALLVMKAPVQ